MSKKEKLTTVFEISIEGNEFLINYDEITNTIPESFKDEYKVLDKLFPIRIDIEDLSSRYNSKQEIQKYIHKEIDDRILIMVKNILSHQGARMICEYKQEQLEA